MTKAEETLHKALLFDGLEESQVPFEELKGAMKQHAIEFAEFTKYYFNYKWGWIKSGSLMWDDSDILSTEQLYDKFNNQEP